MANPIKGEVEVQALGRAWTLQLDFERLCSNEADLPGVMGQGFSLETTANLITLLRVCLINHHPAEATDATVKAIIANIGVVPAMAVGMKCVAWTMGERVIDDGGVARKGAANPPARKRKSGTGPRP